MPVTNDRPRLVDLAGLPPTLSNIPLEYFETAIEWLQHQPRLDGGRIAVSGTSRGGELSLLLGATFVFWNG